MSGTYKAKNHYRGRHARRYEELRTRTWKGRLKWRMEHRAVEHFARHFGLGDIILDAPCGTGRFFPIVRDRGCDLYGIDISEHMLAEVRHSEIAASLICGDLERLPLASNSVDYAICIRFLNLVPDSTRANLLGELRRVVKKGAVVGIRFRQTGPVNQLIRVGRRRVALLFRKLRNSTRSFPELQEDPECEDESPPKKRFPLPTEDEFLSVAEGIGFVLLEARTIGWPAWALQPDPMKICFLGVRRHDH